MGTATRTSRGTTPQVLVLRALGLGDLLTAVPALRGLRRAHPAAQITLAAPDGLTPLALLTGAIDAVADTAPLAPVDPALPAPDLAVNLHGRGPQSTAVLRATGPARLISYGVTSGWREDEHEVARWCRLLAESGIPADPADLDLAVPHLPNGLVIVHPGSASPARRWPADRWAAVARGLAAAGEQVVVTGSPDEVPLAAAVAAHGGLPAAVVRAGRTSLPDLVALVAGARLLVSGDTGIGHLATAVGTPSVLVFGPTSPALWGPPPDRPQHRVVWSGQVGDPLRTSPDPGLLTITPARVLAAAGRQLPVRPRLPASSPTARGPEAEGRT